MSARRFGRLVLVVTLLGACDDATEPTDLGFLELEIVNGGQDAMMLDAARAIVTGPADNPMQRVATLSATATAFVDTIGGLSPGSYEVALEGFLNGELDIFGETSSVQVRAGQNTTASVTVRPFRPTLVSIDTLTGGTGFRVNFTEVSGAAGYVVEWSGRADFAGGVQSTSTSETTVDVPVTIGQQYYVRVRAVNQFGTTGGASPVGTVTVIAPVGSVQVVPQEMWMLDGATTPLTASVRDVNNTVVTDRPVTWSVDDESVATVDVDGVVTAVSAGTAVVTATSEDVSGSGTVHVVDPVLLTLGDLEVSSIDAAGELDFYVFDGAAGDVVFLTLTEGSGFNAGGQRPQIDIFDPDGAMLGSAFFANGQRQDTLPQTGRYTMRVQANNLVSTGTYRLGLEGLNPLTPGAVDLTLGALNTLTIDAASEVDLFTFGGTADDVVFWTVTEGSGFNSGGQAPTVQVFTPSGGQLKSALSANAQRQDTLPETGTYVIRMQANNLVSTGTYALGVEGLNPLSPGAPSLSLGDLTTTTIDASAEADFFTFDGTTDDVVFWTLTEGSGFNSGGQSPTLQVFTPSGDRLRSSMGANSQRQDTLPETGTYVIRIQANNLVSTGTYTFGLEGLNPLSPGATSLILGDLSTATIDGSGEVDFFTFDGTADDVVFWTLTEGSGFNSGGQAPAFQIYAPSGDQVKAVMSADTQRQDTLPETGTYVIRMQANNLVSTGTYTLGLEGLSPLTPGAPALTLGDLSTATIDASAEVDLFTFDGTADDVVFWTLTEGSGFTAGSQAPSLQIFAPSGSELKASISANSQRQDTLPETGTYVVRLQANNLRSTGTYFLGLEGLAPITPGMPALASGDLVQATIDASAEVDLFTFAGTSGDVIFLTLTEGSGFNTGSQAPRIQVFSPSGDLVGSPLNANASRQDTLAEGGTFTIRVNANNLVSTGTYFVGLEGLNPATPDAVSMMSGDVVMASIGSSAELDVYTFVGQMGDQVSVTLAETSGFGGSATPRASLYSPSGTILGTIDTGQQLDQTLDTGGTFVLVVRANNLQSTGTYDLGLSIN